MEVFSIVYQVCSYLILQGMLDCRGRSDTAKVILPTGEEGIAIDWFSKDFVGNYLSSEWLAAPRERPVEGEYVSTSIWNHDATMQELRYLVKGETDQQRKDLSEFLGWSEREILKALTLTLQMLVHDFYLEIRKKEDEERHDAEPLFNEFTNN
jgi:hypothetical protein